VPPGLLEQHCGIMSCLPGRPDFAVAGRRVTTRARPGPAPRTSVWLEIGWLAPPGRHRDRGPI